MAAAVDISRAFDSPSGWHYQLIELIGYGSFGRVFSAKRSLQDLQESVAVKINASPVTYRFVQKEAKRLQCLQEKACKAVAPIFEHFSLPQPPLYCIVLPLFEGSLHSTLRKSPSIYWTLRSVKEQARALLRSVRDLHGHGWIHADLKPANMISLPTRIVLLDMGSAKKPGKPIGQEAVQTSTYRAPEEWLRPWGAWPCDKTVYSTDMDMWSCGCIIAEMCAKTALFAGHDADDKHFFDRCYALLGPVPKELERFTSAEVSFRRDALRQFLSIHPQEAPYLVVCLINLIRSLLSYCPDLRPTAHQALHHPFFRHHLFSQKDALPLLPAGTVLCSEFFQYKIEDQIDATAHTKVIRATRLEDSTPMLLKVTNLAGISDKIEGRLQMIAQKERKWVSHFIAVHDHLLGYCAEASDLPFYAQVTAAYEDSLKIRIQQRRYCDPSLVEQYADLLSQTIAIMHQAEVVHGQLTPAQIYFSALKPQSPMLEFPLYVAESDLLPYLPPEALHAQAELFPSPAWDLWMLGCVLAEALLGKPLFFGLHREEIIAQQREGGIADKLSVCNRPSLIKKIMQLLRPTAQERELA